MSATVLVVDDSRDILEVLKNDLEKRSFAVLVSDNASEALMIAREFRPDVILTDIVMPGLDGRAFCRILKQEPSTRAIPVIMMSGAAVEQPEVLQGYESGAVDYVVKPVSMPLLAAKIKALLRARSGARPPGETIARAGIKLSVPDRSAWAAGKPLDLAPKEFDLLAALAENLGRVLSVNHLLEKVWGLDPAEDRGPRSLEVHVSRLRRKLGAFAGRLVTVRGRGYKLE